MKLIQFILLSLVFISCSRHNKQLKPILSVNQISKNLGKISFDSSTKIDFTIYNNGNGPLIIDTVTVSCECTVPSFITKAILPNDSAILSVTYKPTNSGEFNKAIILRSNIDSIFTILKFYGQVIKI
ncbi:MAG TPA: DUF1573 domain-containing protein [Sediminibacterium sp.]|nr:DUF1573 domain-containing protein [Sediminibacterium sp.]